MTDVVTMPDQMDRNMTDNYELAKMRSPIGFFVLRNDGTLRITAIQRDPVSGKWFFIIMNMRCLLDCSVLTYNHFLP